MPKGLALFARIDRVRMVTRDVGLSMVLAVIAVHIFVLLDQKPLEIGAFLVVLLVIPFRHRAPGRPILAGYVLEGAVGSEVGFVYLRLGPDEFNVRISGSEVKDRRNAIFLEYESLPPPGARVKNKLDAVFPNSQSLAL